MEQGMEKQKDKTKHSNAEKPISLNPLKFDDAMTALLKAKPESKKVKEKENGRCQKKEKFPVNEGIDK